MKLKIKIQMGFYNRKPEDFLVLQQSPEELLQQLDIKPSEFKIKTYKMADGSTHLVEYTLDKLC